MFNGWVIGLVIVVCVIGGIITFRVLKEEENKQRQYKEESGDTAKGELERSLEYEEKSWSSNIPKLTWIYVVSTVISIIALVIYMYLR